MTNLDKLLKKSRELRHLEFYPATKHDKFVHYTTVAAFADITEDMLTIAVEALDWYADGLYPGHAEETLKKIEALAAMALGESE